MSKTFLIDESGRIDLTSRHLSALDSRGALANHQLPEVAETGRIVWLGGERYHSIYFRPSLAHKLARQRILSWLVSSSPQRFHIAYWARKAWHHEICGSATLARDRIGQIFDEYGQGDEVGIGRRIKQQREVEQIKSFHAAIDFWKSHAEQFEQDLHFRELTKITSGAANLFHADGAGSYVPVKLRSGLSPAFAKWFCFNSGAPISAFPDTRFARSVEQAFTIVDEKLTPTADEIDAFQRWPGQYRRLRYHRLILPFRRGHDRWIVSISTFDNTLDLHD